MASQRAITTDVLSDLIGADVSIPSSLRIDGVTEDSRKVKPGFAFVVIEGEHHDGHDFVRDAKQRGAVAVLGARSGIDELEGLPYIRVPHPRRALGLSAHYLAGDPSKHMHVIGVTGTNGKTSTVFLIHQILKRAGHKTASIGTLGTIIDGESIATEHTTPFGEELADLFRRAREKNVEYAVMEVSSHALEQERVAGVDYSIGVFTNLTQDHLDYHADMESYSASKLKLFQSIERHHGFTVVNHNDPLADRFVAASPVTCYLYGDGGDCSASHVETQGDRTVFQANTPWGQAEMQVALLGAHNVLNTLAAVTVTGALGVPLDRIAHALAESPPVPGRFEHIDAGQDFRVIVDYAHTEDGLRNVVTAARELCARRLIVVFGCGGDRDRMKRPKMAAAVAERADFAIITSDNPRTESPERILLDVEVGMQRAGLRRDDDYAVVLDRREAIERALDMAQSDDLVLIAGKGHETYQIIGKEKIPFDDREVARDLLGAKLDL